MTRVEISLLEERNNLRVFFVEVQILLIVTEDQVHTPLQVVSMEKKQLKDLRRVTVEENILHVDPPHTLRLSNLAGAMSALCLSGWGSLY